MVMVLKVDVVDVVEVVALVLQVDVVEVEAKDDQQATKDILQSI